MTDLNLSKHFKEVFQYLLAIVIILTIGWVLDKIFTTGIPEVNKDMGYMLVGAFITAFSQVIHFFFGSSMGSKEKTEMLSKNKETKQIE